MSFQNIYYKRTVATAKPCYVCLRPTTTVLATFDVVDFLYSCDTHLTDPGFATPLPSASSDGPPKPQVSTEDIELIKREYEEKKEKKGKDKDAEKEDKGKGKEKEKEKDDKTGKGPKDAGTATSGKSTPSTSTPKTSSPTPSSQPHARFALHRQFFAMRQDEHPMPVRETASSALRALFSLPPRLSVPIDSSRLLTHIVSWSLTASVPNNSRLRLTDLTVLDGLLREFSDRWEYGNVEISIRRLPGGGTVVTLLRIRVDESPRKRKRESSEEPLASGVQSLPPVQDAHHISEDLREVYLMLQRGTAKGRLLAEQYRSNGSLSFDPICPHVTKEDCIKARRAEIAGFSPSHPHGLPANPNVAHCDRVHFRPLIRPHTDPSLGHCSYLNTCYSEPTYAMSPSIPPPPATPNASGGRIGNMNAVSLPSGLGAGGRGKEKAPCRYLHFEVDYDGLPGEGGVVGSTMVPLSTRASNASVPPASSSGQVGIGLGPSGQRPLLPPQWINCDVRRFDYSVLGKFHVIMADPPWDIHMSLPYGTMTDDEMRAMPIPTLQDEGVIFLWVTGRAMEVGRECLRVWGYTRVDEVVWLKTNQLQRVIRTGRTGHWLNHTKEHMLVGLKTNLDENGNLKWPAWLNRGLDVDVIVSEVRETSRKPDEVYGMIERMCPGGRKLEIFGRKHNTRPGWITLGNQLGQDQIYEEDLAQRIQARQYQPFTAADIDRNGPIIMANYVQFPTSTGGSGMLSAQSQYAQPIPVTQSPNGNYVYMPQNASQPQAASTQAGQSMQAAGSPQLGSQAYLPIRLPDGSSSYVPVVAQMVGGRVQWVSASGGPNGEMPAQPGTSPDSRGGMQAYGAQYGDMYRSAVADKEPSNKWYTKKGDKDKAERKAREWEREERARVEAELKEAKAEAERERMRKLSNSYDRERRLSMSNGAQPAGILHHSTSTQDLDRRFNAMSMTTGVPYGASAAGATQLARPRGVSVSEHEHPYPRSRRVSISAGAAAEAEYARTRKVSTHHTGNGGVAPFFPDRNARGEYERSPHGMAGSLPTGYVIQDGRVVPAGGGQLVLHQTGGAYAQTSPYGPARPVGFPSPGMHGQRLTGPPPSFYRDPSKGLPYSRFETFCIVWDLNELKQLNPPLPALLVPCDVLHDDWNRCISDIMHAWSGVLPYDIFPHANRSKESRYIASGVSSTPASGLRQLVRPTSAVSRTVDIWNASFFYPRRLEMILYRGLERRSGMSAGKRSERLKRSIVPGQYRTALEGRRIKRRSTRVDPDDTDSSSLTSSDTSVSSASEKEYSDDDDISDEEPRYVTQARKMSHGAGNMPQTPFSTTRSRRNSLAASIAAGAMNREGAGIDLHEMWAVKSREAVKMIRERQKIERKRRKLERRQRRRAMREEPLYSIWMTYTR
ncbi:hypothetical protein FRB99_002679 [Tulasnella sp. 403]|nr:hypothetical protein FRB99_002679 [Tulasnella sp. 403]